MRLDIPSFVNRRSSPFAPGCARCRELEAELAQLRAKNADLERGQAEVTQLRSEIKELQTNQAELERRLGLNSTNSSKPPSGDGLDKPERRTTSQRKQKDKKPSGGQSGHEGTTLRQVEHPDKIVNEFPLVCDGCGAALSSSSAGYAARQVFDLPKPAPLEVTEYRAHACRCGCGVVTKAKFPQGVGAPVQYGPRVGGWAIYLWGHHLVPEDRVARAMYDLFGVPMSAATVAEIARRKAEDLAGFTDAVLAEVLAAPAKNMDETGLRVCKKLYWLHVACTPTATHFRVSTRGDMLSGVSGVIVHDYFKSYYKIDGVEHALCGQHILRELQALIDIEKEAWATPMQALLRRACHATNLIRRELEASAGVSEQRKAELLRRLARIAALIGRRYDAVVAKAIAYHVAQPPLREAALRKDGTPSRRRVAKRIGHNLADRLHDRKNEILRFTRDLFVPFTNNGGEQELRVMKSKMKVSGCFRSLEGAKRFATIRTLIATARKRGWDLVECLMLDSTALIARLSSA